MKKKIAVAILLIILILSTNVLITFAATKSELKEQQSDIQDKIDEAEAKQEQVEEKITEATKKIKELTSQIDEYESQIEKLDKELYQKYPEIMCLLKVANNTIKVSPLSDKKFVHQIPEIENLIQDKFGIYAHILIKSNNLKDIKDFIDYVD